MAQDEKNTNATGEAGEGSPVDDPGTQPEPVAEIPGAAPEGARAGTPGRAGARTARREAREATRRRDDSARTPRSPQERQAEREAARRAKAAARSRRRGQERERARAQRTDTPAPTPPAAPPSPGAPKVRQGRVVSDRADKTIIVRIEAARRHPRYEKIVRTSSTLRAHDERNEANEGDRVRVVESRPLSRTKRWRLVEVLERAE